MENRETLLLQRYFRKTPAHPEGSVVHQGDCDFFSIKVCTCGLHHDLMVLDPAKQTEYYELFDIERAEYDEARTFMLHNEPAKPQKPQKKKRKS